MSRCGMRSGGEVAEPIVDSLSGIFLNLATAMPDVFMRRMGDELTLDWVTTQE